MIETAIAFILAYLLTLPAIIGILLVSLYAYDDRSPGSAVFFGLVAAGVALFTYHVSIETVGIAALLYFIAGFIWAVVRYKRLVSETVTQYSQASRHATSRLKEELERISPSNVLGRMTGWVFAWPMSVISNLTGDIVAAVQFALSKLFVGIFARIHGSAMADANALVAAEAKAEAEAKAAKNAAERAK